VAGAAVLLETGVDEEGVAGVVMSKSAARFLAVAVTASVMVKYSWTLMVEVMVMVVLISWMTVIGAAEIVVVRMFAMVL